MTRFSMGTFATAVLLTMACGPAPTTGAGGESEDDSGTGSSTTSGERDVRYEGAGIAAGFVVP